MILFAVISLIIGKVTSQSAPLVPLGIYFEECCPYSQPLIAGTFATAWNTPGFSDIVELVLSPWGHEKYNVTEKKIEEQVITKKPNQNILLIPLKSLSA